MDSSLMDQYKHDDHNTNKSQDNQSNSETNLYEIKDLNIGSNYYMLSCRAPSLRPGTNFLRCCHLALGKVGSIMTFFNMRKSLKKIYEW